MVHLDTNFLIAAVRADRPEAAALEGWLRADEPVVVSAMAWAEFLSGPLTAQEEADARVLVDELEPTTPADAERAAELFNLTGRRSRTLADSLIAATALRCGARVATVNVEDFQPFAAHGLTLA